MCGDQRKEKGPGVGKEDSPAGEDEDRDTALTPPEGMPSGLHLGVSLGKVTEDFGARPC